MLKYGVQYLPYLNKKPPHKKAAVGIFNCYLFSANNFREIK